MTDDGVKVLNIIGSGRSGSTILHNILGQIDDFVAVGEVRDIWGRGLLSDWLCGCGVRFHECELWRQVVDLAYGGKENVDVQEMAELTESFRIRNLPLTWIPALRRRELRRLTPYLERLAALYTAIHQVTDCRVIVDSSKNPSYSYLLNQIPGLDVAYLHFIRDAPAVAYSWTKRKMFEPGKAMPRKSVAKSSLQWDARNLCSELFLPRGSHRRLAVQYEDFMIDPQKTIGKIVDWLGESPTTLPFASSHEVTLDRPNHSVFGNAVRFQKGPVTLRMDNQWRDHMSRRDSLIVNALTLPLRARYGYLRHRRQTVENGDVSPSGGAECQTTAVRP